ncbi:MAG TPA: FUSC family protein, partial [Flavobacteriaceae bacterium]|nr:FUSC family protein [Flavobacteriaceae bacterium]
MQKIFTKVFKNIPVELTKDKFHDALRLALQSSIAASITFLVMKSFNIPEIFLAILSAVLVVEPSIGDTFKQAKGRVYATLVGSAIGFIFVALIPWGFGTAVSLLITMFIMNGIAGLKPSWRYGVVAAVAISLGSEENALATSLDRLIAIVIGITIGILATSVIWPNKASKRANNHLRKALNACKERLEIAYENSKTDDKEDASEVADNFHTYLGRAKGAAEAIKFGNKKAAFK